MLTFWARLLRHFLVHGRGLRLLCLQCRGQKRHIKVYHINRKRKDAINICESVGTAQGSKSPKSGKEGFGVKKLPFPIASEKGALSRKIPISRVEPCREMGIFRLKAPFSEAMGNGSFLTPKPSFPDFGDFDPCTVPTLSQININNLWGVHQIRSPSLGPLQFFFFC